MSELKEEKNVEVVREEDAQLLKSVFKGNDELLISIRAVMLNVDVTEQDKTLVKNTFANEKLYSVVKQRFLPKLNKITPIGTMSDDWLNANSMVWAQMPTTIRQAISYKDSALKMTKTALDLLIDPDGEKVDINYNPITDDELGCKLLARNQFIKHIEQQLLMIKMIADREAEKPEEIEKRNKLNSSK